MRSAGSLAVGVACVVFAGACATAENLPNDIPGLNGGAPAAAGGEAPGSAGTGAPETGGTDDGAGGTSNGTGNTANGSGNSANGTGNTANGSGSTANGTGGRSSGSGGSSSGTGSSSGSGGATGAGGAGCFLGICPPSTGGMSGGGFTIPDAGTSHKAMCNQKLCVDPVFDCALQGCADAICQIPFCVIK